MRKYFQNERFHKDIVEKGLVALASRISGGYSEGNTFVFEGGYEDLTKFPEQKHIIAGLVRSFVFNVKKYYLLRSEEDHLENAESHYSYLRTVASTVMCAIFLMRPELLDYTDGTRADFDLTCLPWWVRRIIKKFIVHPDYRLFCTYYGYDMIAEE